MTSQVTCCSSRFGARRSTPALLRAAHQESLRPAALAAIERVAGVAGLADVATLRLANPDATLAELGALLDPPRSKGAVLARLRRLEALVASESAEEE